MTGLGVWSGATVNDEIVQSRLCRSDECRCVAACRVSRSVRRCLLGAQLCCPLMFIVLLVVCSAARRCRTAGRCTAGWV